MKFTVKKEDLLPLLTRVNNIVEKKSTQKINTHILIVAEEKQVKLVGFDKEIKISGHAPAEVEITGETTVNAQKFHAIINSLSANKMACIALDENNLNISVGESEFHLSVIPAEEYPLPEEYTFEQNIVLNANRLVKLLEQVKFSMAHNDVRYYLNGLLLHFTQSTLYAVSTDGHRLSVAEMENTSEITDQRIILPNKAVSELIKWLSQVDETVAISLSDSHIQITYQQMELTSALINAQYPAYESVIPELSDKLIMLPKEEFREALNRAKILSSEHSVGVSLHFNPWKLNLSAKNMDNESVEEQLDINYDGEPIKIAFNINYLLDIIGAIEGKDLTLSLQDSHSSCLIYDNTNQAARYVVMPMNI